MYKGAAIIIIFSFSRYLLRNNLYNKSQLSLLVAFSKFHKNSQRILFSIILLYSEILLSVLSPETFFSFDWFMILCWSCFCFVLNIFGFILFMVKFSKVLIKFPRKLTKFPIREIKFRENKQKHEIIISKQKRF